MFRQQLLDTSRGRIVAALQHGPLTIDDIASQLGLTSSAVRAQMTAMQRDGVVRRVGRRSGPTRPSHLFELTPEVDQQLSQAYVPFLTQLIQVFANVLPANQLDALLSKAGEALADALLGHKRPTGSLESRVRAASVLLNEQLGALTRVEHGDALRIQGAGCPLAAVTGTHPAVCLAMERFVAQVVGAEVRACCERHSRPRCCFEIEAAR